MDSCAGRVIVGYDGSAHAAVAVDWAAAEAQRRGLPLTVLHVRSSSNPMPGMVGALVIPEGQPDTLNDVAAEGVARARKSATSIDVEGVTEVGGVARALIESSREVELIVVGSRGHGETTEALLGSVAFAVSAHARCPVIVIGHAPPPAVSGSNSIVVGVDGSPGSDAAVRFAASTATRTALPLTIVSAYGAPTVNGWAAAAPYTLQGGGGPTASSVARDEALTVTAAATRIARAEYPGVLVREVVTEGRSSSVLAEVSAGAELLVVGSRGHGGFAGLLLGSVSHGVLQSALCPVAIVRSQAGHEKVARVSRRGPRGR